MPELPEVETICRDLQQTVLLKKISTVIVNDPLIIKGITPKVFVKELSGQTIQQIYRRGKALVLSLSNGFYWVVQPMMTGQMVCSYPSEKPAILKETRVLVTLSDGGMILYNDQRRFGHLRLVKDVLSINYFRVIGPEPLTNNFNSEYLAQALKNRQRPIKNVLLDHTVVAGIGNIYASEILFRAKIKPTRLAGQIKKNEIMPLYHETVKVLEEAIKLRGSSMRNYRDGRGQKGTFNTLIRVYAKEGEPCVICKKPIIKIVQAGRSTFYCKHCQY